MPAGNRVLLFIDKEISHMHIYLTECVAGVLLGSEDRASCFNRNLPTSLPGIKMIPADCLSNPLYEDTEKF